MDQAQPLVATVRADLIAELADDIACGDTFGRYDASYFLDTLIDGRRVTSDDVAILITHNDLSDVRINVEERVRKLVESSAMEFFTNDDRGVEFISDRLAAHAAELEAEAA